MAEPDAVFIYIGTYPSEAAARADYCLLYTSPSPRDS